MEYIKLGNSDLNVSKICLGCMGFGEAKQGMHSWTLGEEESIKIIKKAIDEGINFFDTASAYQGGTSEKFLGQAIKKLTKREDVIIATKFLPRSEKERIEGVSVKEYIDKMISQSLKNLDTEYIDLYIYHMWDYNTSIEEIMEALNEEIIKGRIRYIGIANCFAWQLEKANYIAEKNGWHKFISVQNHYNMIFREEEREMFSCCMEENIAMTPYSPLASGRLVKNLNEKSKRLEADDFAKGKYDLTAKQDEIIIKRVAELAERKGMTKIQIALGWLFTKVDAPIVGATKISHIEDAISAISVKLSKEEVDFLDEPYIPHKLVGVMAQIN